MAQTKVSSGPGVCDDTPIHLTYKWILIKLRQSFQSGVLLTIYYFGDLMGF